MHLDAPVLTYVYLPCYLIGLTTTTIFLSIHPRTYRARDCRLGALSYTRVDDRLHFSVVLSKLVAKLSDV